MPLVNVPDAPEFIAFLATTAFHQIGVAKSKQPTGRATETAFPAALFSGPQLYRTDVAGPERERHADPNPKRNVNRRCSQLPDQSQPAARTAKCRCLNFCPIIQSVI